ncbi:MAG: zinc-dependent alcohol dehydrogenase family protein [Rhizobiaceae bacterium]
MKAVVYEGFGQEPTVQSVDDPAPSPDGVVVRVMATGVCRSDWHGWMGHDPGIKLPHIPGHEFAGVIEAVGKNVRKWEVGARVTVPFVAGCGSCFECHSGNQHVCPDQFQPGFSSKGSFAEYVGIDFADTNLVALPEAMDFATAASLGCRFVTSFRAVVDQGQVMAGQWVVVHGCGGVGLSAIMIANAIGANVIAVDITDDKLELAKTMGAIHTVNASKTASVGRAVRDLTGGGAHVSLDALGHPTTCYNSISNLRRRGTHVQVGLMLGEHTKPQIPMARVIAHELKIVGSHGMQAHRYDAMFTMIQAGKLSPEKLVKNTITLEQSIGALTSMDEFQGVGVTVVTEF